MHPSQIPSVKQRVLRADAGRLSSYLADVLSSDDPQRSAEFAFAAYLAESKLQ